MRDDDLLRSVTELLHAEAAALDDKRWDDWLALYAEDAEYWVPAWDSELEQTKDPNAEISFIYYDSRAGLEDRVYRLRLNQSSASIPLPRTCHLVTNIRAAPLGDGSCNVRANWQVHSYRFEKTTTFYGFYDYRLARNGACWRITRKKTTVLNDLIPTVLDFYSV
jgi:3-phenylpropionate/cinnamic acid dioxygenase small subunit